MTQEKPNTEQPPDALLIQVRNELHRQNETLRSINGKLSFFVFLAVLAIVLQGCGALLAL